MSVNCTTSKNTEHTSNVNPPPYSLIFGASFCQQQTPNNKPSAIRQASCTPNPTARVRLDHRREAATATRPSTRPLRHTVWLRQGGAGSGTVPTATGSRVAREWLRACRGTKKSMAAMMIFFCGGKAQKVCRKKYGHAHTLEKKHKGARTKRITPRF